MAVEEKSKTPVGKALYLEFRRNTSTYQLIITPAGKTNVEGVEKEVDAVVFRRLVSDDAPRSQWRTSRLRNTSPSEPFTTEEEVFNAVNDAWIKSGINYQIASLGDASKWSLYKQPVVVEASEEDLKDAFTNSTPNALIKRIRKVREVLGFEESFYALPSSAL
jgi:hypothetical protein